MRSEGPQEIRRQEEAQAQEEEEGQEEMTFAPRLRSRALLLIATVATLTTASCAFAGNAAAAPAPYWSLSATQTPANIAPGGDGKLIVRASNLGDALLSAEQTITVTDKLPAGVEATAVSGKGAHENTEGTNGMTCKVPKTNASEFSCTYHGDPLEPLEGLHVKASVTVQPSVSVGTLTNNVEVSGGGLPNKSLAAPIRISGEEAQFGVEKYEFKPEEEGGEADDRAGTHPFQLTSTVAINLNSSEEPVHPPKNLEFKLPPGLLGNPNAIPQCSETDFLALDSAQNLCPADTAVGEAEVTVAFWQAFPAEPGNLTVPVWNLQPAPGEPARFGISVENVPVVLDTSLRTGSDYGVNVTARNTSESAGLDFSRVTVWGVPDDRRHDSARGWDCVSGGNLTTLEKRKRPCEEQTERLEKQREESKEEPKPFLSLPSSCEEQLATPMRAQSWVAGSAYVGAESAFSEGLTGCGELPFSPATTVAPDTQSGSTPAGLGVDVTAPQEEKFEGRAESTLRATTVVLPPGLQLNPAAAGGLEACSAMDMGYLGSYEPAQTNNDEFSPGVGNCPAASKVGTVYVKSPDLKNPITGAVYLGTQNTNPFSPPLVMYINAEDPVSGVVVKLAGHIFPCQAAGEDIEGETCGSAGQLVSTFTNTPQAPFTEFKLNFFGGGRASLSTPELCGTYTTGSSFTPWSGNAAVGSNPSFAITSGPGGGPCSPYPQAFTPGFAAGSSNLQAAAFTPFTLTLTRPDGDQPLSSLSVQLPPGMAAMLSSVTPCPEPQAAENACAPESLIGHSYASSGLGGEPFTLPGSVYLTGPYKGAPFGISVVTPAVAGPFNLGDVTVRSTINIDPYTAAVTITSDPFPTMLKGVPTQIKQINVVVDRPNFQFNPSNCQHMGITGAIYGAQGAAVPVASPFQVANCAGLAFKPKLSASVTSQGSKANGVGFYVKVESQGVGVDNIKKVKLTIPSTLPSRQTTLKQACLDNTFEVNPAMCPEGSNIGRAIIHTPVLKNPLSGPAYLVSHGNAAFPDVEFVLQGEGITLILDGKTDIKRGITYSTFESTPDDPFTVFETELPAGPHGILTDYVAANKNYSLCGEKLQIPTEIGAQNGALVKRDTPVALIGHCVASYKASRAQKLARALKKCRKKKNKHKRKRCERAARKKYGPNKKAKTHHHAKKK
jgi:hypothetical protein